MNQEKKQITNQTVKLQQLLSNCAISTTQVSRQMKHNRECRNRPIHYFKQPQYTQSWSIGHHCLEAHSIQTCTVLSLSKITAVSQSLNFWRSHPSLYMVMNIQARKNIIIKNQSTILSQSPHFTNLINEHRLKPSQGKSALAPFYLRSLIFLISTFPSKIHQEILKLLDKSLGVYIQHSSPMTAQELAWETERGQMVALLYLTTCPFSATLLLRKSVVLVELPTPE